MMWITTKDFRVCGREITKINSTLRLSVDKDWDKTIQLTEPKELELHVDRITSKISDYIYIKQEDLVSIN